jgi:predicted transcriptional regulator
VTEQRKEEAMIDTVGSGSMLAAKDIMTTEVATVSLDEGVHEIATRLIDRGISGVPVVVDGTVVGIVTAGISCAGTRSARIGARRRGLGGSGCSDAGRDPRTM